MKTFYKVVVVNMSLSYYQQFGGHFSIAVTALVNVNVCCCLRLSVFNSEKNNLGDHTCDVFKMGIG